MMKFIASTFGVIGVILVLVALIIFMPFLTIWAANTLFPVLAIPYTLDTWFATILLGVFFRGTGSAEVKK